MCSLGLPNHTVLQLLWGEYNCLIFRCSSIISSESGRVLSQTSTVCSQTGNYPQIWQTRNYHICHMRWTQINTWAKYMNEYHIQYMKNELISLIVNEIYGAIFILLFAFLYYSFNGCDHFGKDQERYVSKVIFTWAFKGWIGVTLKHTTKTCN